MVEVKGTLPIATMEFVKSKFGDPGYQKWINSLSPGSRNIIEGMLLSNGWYPLKESMVEPQRKICQLFYMGNLEKSREIGAFSAEKALRGIYKIFVKLGSPEFIIKRASRISSTFYKGTNMVVVASERKTGIVRWSSFPDIDPVVEYRTAGWMQRALEMSGCKFPKVQITKSLTKGHPYTEFKGTWQ